MKHLPTDIIEACKIIRDTCAEQIDCYDCPFHTDKKVGNGCLINEQIPGEWAVTDKEPQTWRAIKY